MVSFSGLILLAGSVFLLRTSPTALRAGSILLGTLLLIAGSPGFLVGVWWLILFTRKNVIAEFAETPRPTQQTVDDTFGTTEHGLFQNHGVPEPFTVLRARAVFGSMGLALLATLGMLLAFLLAGRAVVGRNSAFGAPLALGLTSCFFYGFTALFLFRRLRRAHLSPRMILGREIGWHQVRPYWFLPILLMGVSLTGYFALYFPLSFLLPRFVEGYAIRSQRDPLQYSGFGYQAGNILTMLAMVVAAPIVEEFIFRGILLTRWAVKWGTLPAILLSSAIFGILHTEIIGHMFFAYVMAVLYIETRSLLLPILMHAINNGIVWVFVLFGAAHSRPTTQSSLATLRTQGPAILLMLSAIFLPWALWFLIRHIPNRKWTAPYLQFRKAATEPMSGNL